MSQEQNTALQIVQTSNRIATPEQLAAVIQDKTIPRFMNLEQKQRVVWLGQMIIALNYMSHSVRIPTEVDLLVESTMLDQMIMDDEGLRGLKQVEMQEAFRRGITREYGDFFGITASSLINFLKGYKRGEKRQKAISLIYQKEQEEQREADKRFWQEMERARREQGLELPNFKTRPLETYESEKHRKLIEEQRRKILNNE